MSFFSSIFRHQFFPVAWFLVCVTLTAIIALVSSQDFASLAVGLSLWSVGYLLHSKKTTPYNGLNGKKTSQGSDYYQREQQLEIENLKASVSEMMDVVQSFILDKSQNTHKQSVEANDNLFETLVSDLIEVVEFQETFQQEMSDAHNTFNTKLASLEESIAEISSSLQNQTMDYVKSEDLPNYDSKIENLTFSLKEVEARILQLKKAVLKIKSAQSRAEGLIKLMPGMNSSPPVASADDISKHISTASTIIQNDTVTRVPKHMPLSVAPVEYHMNQDDTYEQESEHAEHDDESEGEDDLDFIAMDNSLKKEEEGFAPKENGSYHALQDEEIIEPSSVNVSNSLNNVVENNPMTSEQSVDPTQQQKPQNSDAPRKVVRTLEEVLRSTTVKKRPKLEVMLQPIFSLPERDVVMFEAYGRLDDKNIHERIKDFSQTLAAEELRNVDIDMCEHILHIIESSNQSNSSLCLIYNVSLDVLDDNNSFGTITQKILASNIDTNNLIIEITQKDFNKLDDSLESKLKMLTENDIRLSLDNITDWSLSLERLKDIGFSFIKLPAVDFIQRAPTPEKADTLHNAFQEYGLEVIAEKIESENVLSELLKRNLKFGQGYHLAPPEYIESDPYTA